MGFAILQINSNVFVYQDMLEFTAFAYATMSKGLTPASTRLTSFSSVIGRQPFESWGPSAALPAARIGITPCHIGRA
jgi:hypothetical protein